MTDVFTEIDDAERERGERLLEAANGPVKRAIYQTVQGNLNAARAYYRAAVHVPDPKKEVAMLGELRTAIVLVQEQIEARRDDLLSCLEWQEDVAEARVRRIEAATEASECAARPWSDFAELG